MIKKILKISGYTILVLFILFCGLPYLFPAQEAMEIPAKPFVNSNFIVVNKTRIHYRVWKPDSVGYIFFFVHGFSDSTLCFLKNIDILQKNNCLVVAIDLPAFGYSDKGDTADYAMENVFSIIDTLTGLHAKPGQKWHWVGHSMGASVAGTYAAVNPEKVLSLTLIDGVPVKVDKAIGFGNSLLKFPPLLRWADVVAAEMSNFETFKGLVNSAYACIPDSEAVNGYLQPFLYKGSGSAIFRMAAMQKGIDFKEDNLDHFSVNIIWGSKDTWLPIDGMRNFLQKHPKARGSVINGAGHCPMETHYREVNAILTRQIL